MRNRVLTLVAIALLNMAQPGASEVSIDDAFRNIDLKNPTHHRGDESPLTPGTAIIGHDRQWVRRVSNATLASLGTRTDGAWTVQANSGEVLAAVAVHETARVGHVALKVAPDVGWEDFGVGTALGSALRFCRGHGMVKVTVNVPLEIATHISSMGKRYGFMHSRTRVFGDSALIDLYPNLYLRPPSRAIKPIGDLS